MTQKEIENKISLVENIGGMTVNERLYVCGLDKEFEKALKNDKLKAEKILELLKVEKLSIELILKQYMVENITKPNLLKRFIAGFIDYLLVYVFFFVFVYSFGVPNDEGGYSVTGILALVPIVFWFAIIVLTEVFFGATLGNSIVGLVPKSLTKNNGELSMSQSIKRHLLDPIDMFPFGLIGIMTIKNTDRNQRLGDIWAKTIVTEVENK